MPNLLKTKKEREHAIFLAEDRFNYWMDIYPRSSLLNQSFEDLYAKHKKSLS